MTVDANAEDAVDDNTADDNGANAGAADDREADDDVRLPTGTTIGGYVILDWVGRGAMSHIYRAKHRLLGKEVALKLLPRQLMRDEHACARLLHEAQITAALKHPNIVNVSDALVHHGTPYLVMEMLSGTDLESHLARSGRLSHEETIELGLALASALAAAHARGIVHRDVKPGNVFLARTLGGEIVPKLLDFGIARGPALTAAPDLSTGLEDQVIGSPLYLAPEGVRGASHLDARSDQYALGVVLYECATGHPPFNAHDLQSLLQAICTSELRAPSALRPDIPEALEQIILRAMNRDRSQRFDHMFALGVSLLELAGPRARMMWARAFGQEPVFELPIPLERRFKGSRQSALAAPAGSWHGTLALPSPSPSERPSTPSDLLPTMTMYRPRRGGHRALLAASLLAAIPGVYWIDRASDSALSSSRHAMAPVYEAPAATPSAGSAGPHDAAPATEHEPSPPDALDAATARVAHGDPSDGGERAAPRAAEADDDGARGGSTAPELDGDGDEAGSSRRAATRAKSDAERAKRRTRKPRRERAQETKPSAPEAPSSPEGQEAPSPAPARSEEQETRMASAPADEVRQLFFATRPKPSSLARSEP